MPHTSVFTGKIKRVLSALCALTALFGLSACAPEARPSGTASAVSTQSASARVTPRRGGELVIPMSASPKSAHPLYLQETAMVNLYWLIFEPLIALDENNLPESCLADSWEYDGEQGIFIIKIRSGVQWHGERGEVTAGDVVFTLNQILSDQESIYNKQVSQYIEEVSMGDLYTVLITPRTASYALLYSLNVPIIPQSYYQNLAADTSASPIGSGPYAVLEADMGQASGMTLGINEKWWKKQPYIEIIRARGYADNDSALAAFERGELDCVYTDRLTADMYAMKEDVQAMSYPSYYYDFLAVNLEREPLGERAVRQAISYAIDRKSIVSNIYLDHAVLSETPFMPGTALNDTSAVRYDYSLSAAEELLDSAGWLLNEEGKRVKDGKTLEIEIVTLENTDNPVKKDTASAIARQLELAGVTVKVTALEREELDKRAAEKNYDLLLTQAYLSGSPDMRFMYAGEGNISGYSSPELDKLLEAVDNQPQRKEFFEALYALHRAMAEELPHIGLFFQTQTLLYRTGVYPSGLNRDLNVFSGIDKWFIAE